MYATYTYTMTCLLRGWRSTSLCCTKRGPHTTPSTIDRWPCSILYIRWLPLMLHRNSTNSPLSMGPFTRNNTVRLPKRPCSDHIFQILARYQNCSAWYSLYIDFKKTFNTVPHEILFRTLDPPVTTPQSTDTLVHLTCKPEVSGRAAQRLLSCSFCMLMSYFSLSRTISKKGGR